MSAEVETIMDALLSFSSGEDVQKPAGQHDHRPMRMTFAELAERLKTPQVGVKGAGGYFLAAEFKEGHRTSEDVIGDPAFVAIDLDAGDWSLEDLELELDDWQAIAHTTASHRIEAKSNPNGEARWRVVISLGGQKLTLQEFRLLAQSLHRRLGVDPSEGGDLCGQKLTQPIYWPTAEDDAAAEQFEFIDHSDRAPMPVEEMARLVEEEAEREARAAIEVKAEQDRKRRERDRSGNNGPSVIDEFNDRRDVRDLLAECGYKQAGQSGNRWISPRSASGSASIVVLESSDGRERVYSHRASDERTEWKCMDAFDLYRLHIHKGETGAAVKAAAKTLGMDQAPRLSVVDGGGGSLAEAGNDQLGEWEEPVQLGHRELAAFPLDALSEPLGDLSRAVSESADACPDLVACAGLGAMSTLTAGRVGVRMSESWTNPVAIYTATLAGSSAGKGPAFSFANAPLEAAQSSLFEGSRDQVRQAQSRYRIAKKRADKLEEAAAKASADEREQAEREALEAASEFGRMAPPQAPRYFIGDDTTEAGLAGALAANQQRLGIISAEGRTLFDGAGGRHSSSGAPEMRLLISGWSGEYCSQIRVGRGETDLPHPQLSITVALQPDTFDTFVRRPDLRDAGLFNRFLIARPQWTGDLDTMPDGAVPKAIVERWGLLVRDLSGIPEQGHNGNVIEFDPEAYEAFSEMRLRFRQQRKPGGLFAGIPEYGPKFDANLGRLCGLLHCAQIAEHGESRFGYEGYPIRLDTVARVETIASYFAQHAAASFSAAGLDEGARRALVLLRRFREWMKAPDGRIERDDSGRAFVSVRTIQRDAAGDDRVIKGRADIIEGCNLLAEHGWLRDAGRGPRKKPGRAGQWFELHPTALESEE